MSHDHQDELDWLAFQYVAGEMTLDEADHFELLLADDQAARDAVCRASDLAMRLRKSRSLPRDKRLLRTTGWASNRRALSAGSRLVRPLGWATAGAAAATLVLYIVQPFKQIELVQNDAMRHVAQTLPAENREPVADAAVWAQLHINGEWQSDFELLPTEPKSIATDLSGDLLDFSPVPPWLLAATANSNAGGMP